MLYTSLLTLWTVQFLCTGLSPAGQDSGPLAALSQEHLGILTTNTISAHSPNLPGVQHPSKQEPTSTRHLTSYESVSLDHYRLTLQQQKESKPVYYQAVSPCIPSSQDCVCRISFFISLLHPHLSCLALHLKAMGGQRTT